MCPSLIQIGLKTAEKNSAQTNRHTNRHYENNGHLAVNQQAENTRCCYLFAVSNSGLLLSHPVTCMYSRKKTFSFCDFFQAPDHKLWPVMLTLWTPRYDEGENHAKHLDQSLFCWTVIVSTETYTQTQTYRQTANQLHYVAAKVVGIINSSNPKHWLTLSQVTRH